MRGVAMQDFLAAKDVVIARYLHPSAIADVAHRRTRRQVGVAAVGAQHNVHAVGVGFKKVLGKRTDVLSIRFYVIQKLPKSLIAPLFLLPKTVDGLPVDVIEQRPSLLLGRRKKIDSPTISSQPTVAPAPSNTMVLATPVVMPPSDVATLQSKNRPYFGGVAAANMDVMGGTLGYFCRSATDDAGKRYILGNSHVFGGFGNSTPDISVLQQPIGNGGLPSNTIANFVRSVPLDFSPNAQNKVDAAIAEVLVESDCEIAVGGIGVLSGRAIANHGDIVRKCGATSGLSSSVVTDVSHSAVIPLDPRSPAASLSLVDQLYLEPGEDGGPVAYSGDSGAIVVNATGNAVGLLCAGDAAAGRWALANKIANVCSQLSIELL